MEETHVRKWTHRAEDSPGAFETGTPHVVVRYHGSPGGDGRCEDAALIIHLAADSHLLAVADGMGSGPRADDASAAIVQSLAKRAEALADEGASRLEVLNAIEEANEAIRGWGVGAATTVVVAKVDAGAYRTYHVGDSEALVTGQRGKLKWQTISHSPVGYAQASGLLDAHDAMVHEERHLVHSMLGMEGMRVDVGERRRFAAFDTLVLGSDGLFDNLEVSEIVEIIRRGPLDKAANALLSRSLERMIRPETSGPGKPDDIAFVLYRPSPTTSRSQSQ
jgi:serine/threonine protein phosphatase PrpC